MSDDAPKRKQVGTLYGKPVYEVDVPIPFPIPDMVIGKMNLIKKEEQEWSKNKSK